MQTKKLLIIGSSQGSYGGIEAFMIAVAEAAMDWPEFDVKLCFKLVQGAIINESLKHACQKIYSSVYYVERLSVNLLKLIAWADVLHVQNTPPDVVLPAKILNKRILLTIHNWRNDTNDLRSWLWYKSMKLADQRWYNSRFVWNTWEPANQLLNSDCVPTICRLPTLSYPSHDRKGFLFIGRWIHNKGIQEILRAYSLCQFDSDKWPLTLIGDGILRPEIISLTEELGLTRVNMPGFVDDKTKAHILASSKWLLAPAKTREDLGLTPIEARSVGVPSIVTRDGGLLEAGGAAALIAEPGDVDDLARCMKIASEMNDAEYEERKELSRRSLADFLKPVEFYRHAYAS